MIGVLGNLRTLWRRLPWPRDPAREGALKELLHRMEAAGNGSADEAQAAQTAAAELCRPGATRFATAPLEWSIAKKVLPALRRAQAFDAQCAVMAHMRDLARDHRAADEAEFQKQCFGPIEGRVRLLKQLARNADPEAAAANWRLWNDAGAAPRAILLGAAGRILKRLNTLDDLGPARAFARDPGTVAAACQPEIGADVAAEWSLCAAAVPVLRNVRAYQLQCVAMRRMAQLRKEAGVGTLEEYERICLGKPESREDVLVALVKKAEPAVAAAVWRDWQETGGLPRDVALNAAHRLVSRLKNAKDTPLLNAFTADMQFLDLLCAESATTAESAPREWALAKAVAPALRSAKAFDGRSMVAHHMHVLRTRHGAGTEQDYQKHCFGKDEEREATLIAISKRAKPALAAVAWSDWREADALPREALLSVAVRIHKRLKTEDGVEAANAFIADPDMLDGFWKSQAPAAAASPAEEKFFKLVSKVATKKRDYSTQLKLAEYTSSTEGQTAAQMVRQALALVGLGDYEAALQIAEVARKAEPSSFEPLQIIFRVYGLRKQNEEARCHLALLKNTSLLSEFDLGRLAEEGSQIDLALRHYQTAWRAAPENADLYLHFCRKLMEFGAIFDLVEVLSAEPAGLPDNDRRKRLRRVVDMVTATSAWKDRGDAEPELNELLIEEICRVTKATGAAAPTLDPSEPMRVAIVIDSLGPGGAPRQCAVLAAKLVELRAKLNVEKVVVFVRNLKRRERDAFFAGTIKSAGAEVVQCFDPSLGALSDVPGVDPRIVELASAIQPADRGASITQLMGHLQAFRPHVVYGWLDELVLQCAIASAALPSARALGRWGSMPPGQFRQETPRRLIEAERQRRGYAVLRRHFGGIGFFANTRAAADAYGNWLEWEERAVGVIHNGFDAEAITPSSKGRASIRQSLGVPDEAFVFGTIARLAEEKRPFMLCDIAQKLSRRTERPVYLLFVGDGPLLELVRDYARRRGQDNVLFAGRQEKVADWYSALDCFVLTSSVEGLSNSLLEAQATGRPAVCFDVGGMAEGMEDGKTGYLVPDADVDQFVERLATLAENPAAAEQMGRTGAQFVRKTFPVERMAEVTAAAFRP